MTAAAAPPGFARPGPHLVLKDAFGSAMVERLLAYAVGREADFLESFVGAEGRIDKSVRRSHRLDVSDPVRPAVEAGFRSALPPARSAFGIAAFEPASLALELVAHGDGDFYGRHIDTLIRTSPDAGDRVLTGVYYFHAEPKAFSGGELRLHSLLHAEQGGSHVDIDPATTAWCCSPPGCRTRCARCRAPESISRGRASPSTAGTVEGARDVARPPHCDRGGSCQPRAAMLGSPP